MVIKDELEFLNLPDWKKVHLKISYSKFINYRMMTEDQEQNRKHKIFSISSHYGKIDIEELKSNPNITLDNSWPKNIEKYVTPRLLDLFSVDWFCKFGKCFCCNYFSGYTNLHFKLLNAKKPKNKIHVFSGKCRHILNCSRNKSSHLGRQHEFVDPNFCCHLWEPMDLYFQIIQVELGQKLESPGYEYKLEDYAFDLHNVNIWTYFFNKYDRQYDY
jgi:hypothetical protein